MIFRSHLKTIAMTMAVTLALTTTLGAQVPPTSVAAEQPTPTPQPTFSGELEVSLMNVFVTVVDDDGRTVRGLTKEHFAIREQGQLMEITNFVEIIRDDGSASSPQASPSAEAPLVDMDASSADDAGPAEPRRIVLLFDNASLEKRSRKRVLKSLTPFVREHLQNGGEIMLASFEPELEIITPFTSDLATIEAVLKKIKSSPSVGDMTKSAKRILRRDIATADTVKAHTMPAPRTSGSSGGSSGGIGQPAPPPLEAIIGFDDNFTAQQSQQLLARINNLRYKEYARIHQSLVGIDSLSRSLSGISGKKDVLWIGQDLALRPAMDVYSAYYNRFQQWAVDLNIENPHFWSTEVNLTEEFKFVAAGAQASGATLHFLDCTDRDRDQGNTDFGSAGIETETMISTGGSGNSRGYNFSDTRDLVDGSQYLAIATGGDVFFNSRRFEGFFGRLEQRLGSYYSIGYRRPGPADGKLHEIDVVLDDDTDAKAHHHRRLLNRTPVQKLADETLSRLELGVGIDNLALRVEIGEAQPTEKEQVIREVKLFIPARNLVLADEGANRVGRVMVALQSQSKSGQNYPPQVMQLTIKVPTDRLSPVTTTSAALRLLMRPDTAKVSVGVVDTASGSSSTHLIDVPE